MASTACTRCGETLVDPTRRCEFCFGERVTDAVRTLVAAAGCDDSASLKARADATDELRILGFTQQQVLHVRARVLDGHSVEEIVGDLVHGVEESEAVAA